MDFDDLIKKAMLESLSGGDKKADKLSRADALEAIEKFQASHREGQVLEVGDLVERNYLGQERYKAPTGNQVAMVVQKLNPPQIDDNGQVCDIVIAVTFSKSRVLTFMCESAYYTKAEEKKNIVHTLFRKKD